jgi:hypothetical protein
MTNITRMRSMDTPPDQNGQDMYDIQREVARDHIDALLTEAEIERTARSGRRASHGSISGGARGRL